MGMTNSINDLTLTQETFTDVDSQTNYHLVNFSVLALCPQTEGSSPIPGGSRVSRITVWKVYCTCTFSRKTFEKRNEVNLKVTLNFDARQRCGAAPKRIHVGGE